MKTLALYFLISISFAQNQMIDPGRPGLRQEGQLFFVQIVPDEPLRIFIAGKEEAKIDLSKMKLIVRRLKPYPEKILTTSRVGDHFVVSRPLDFNESMNLEVTTKLNQTEEKMNFSVPARFP